MSDIRYEDGKIIVPGVDQDGNLQTVQTISDDGEKHFAKGCPKAGAMHIIGPIRDTHFNEDGSIIKTDVSLPKHLGKIDHKFGEILVCEGYATGASLHLATGKPVVVAFDSGNLKNVAQAIRKDCPMVRITICADNDHKNKTNVGLEKAKKAALASQGDVVMPKFTQEEMDKGLTDFNDLHQSRGLEVVKEALKTKEVEFIPTKEETQKAKQSVGLSR